MFVRLAIRTAATSKRVTPAAMRCNSSSASSTAARVMHMAAQAERPSAVEATVPAMWVACAALGYFAWNRMNERTAAGNVEKLLVL